MTCSRVVQFIVVLALSTWWFGWAGTVFLSSTRVIFAAAFDRLLPEKVAEIDARTRTPIYALILMVIPSLLVAALFAWHPLHVEAVAWVSARKDVLSAFFWLGALWLYARYVEVKVESGKQKAEKNLPASDLRPLTSGYYWLALVFFTLGLMAKATVVTLPFFLLLLDYWPLRRFQFSTLNSQPATVRLQCEAYFL